MIPVRIRVGVAQYPDGWNVVVKIGDELQVYDPAFATEAEAEAAAAEASRGIRERMKREGYA